MNHIRKTKKNTKSSKIINNKYLNKYLTQAESIFNDFTFIKNSDSDKFEKYWIISKNYDYYINPNKYHITHFFLYCLLRFREHENKQVILKCLSFPVILNTKPKIFYPNKYNSFTYLFYLNNFIYHLLEKNENLNNFIKESKLTKWGYNVNITTYNNCDYYNIYYVAKYKDLATVKTLMSILYPKKNVDEYIESLKLFIKNNFYFFQINNFLTDIYQFYNIHKFDYKNKYIYIDNLYIPKCHISLNEIIPSDNVLKALLYKEVNYPTNDRLEKLSMIFNKYRNIEQLKNDLSNANININDFNNMIKNIKPLAFQTKTLYRNFITDLAKIVKTKFNKFTLKVIGSSTTFYSASPKSIKTNKFFSITDSDVDVNIIPNEDFSKYIPELENLNTEKIDTTIGVYVNQLTRDFFGEKLMSPFFKKWGPNELLEHVVERYPYVDIEKTILKRHISITLSTKVNMFEYFDIIKNNKTCLSNFSTFINNNELSYWDENGLLIKEKI